MSKEHTLAVFENFKIRRVYDEKSETWYFSVVDIVAALMQQPEYQTARKYWTKLKERLKKEGCQSVTNCHQLKSPNIWKRTGIWKTNDLSWPLRRITSAGFTTKRMKYGIFQ